MKRKYTEILIDNKKLEGWLEVNKEDLEIIYESDLKDIDLILVVPKYGISLKLRLASQSDE